MSVWLNLLLILNSFNTLFIQFCQSNFHGFYLFGWMTLPDSNFPYDLKWLLGTVRFSWVTGEFFVGKIGVIFNGSGWLYKIYPFPPFTQCQLCSPDCGIQGRCEVNIPGILFLAVIGIKAHFDKVTQF